MTPKTIQISVRITDDDATFLAKLDIEGAQTPSDKIRALLADARRRHHGVTDYRSSLGRVAELLAPAHRELQASEHTTGQHSELVRLVDDWLGETVAFFMSELPEGLSEHPEVAEALEQAERGLANRAFTLIESILRLGVTERGPCYDASAISARLEPVLALLDVIRAAKAVTASPGKPQKAKEART